MAYGIHVSVPSLISFSQLENREAYIGRVLAATNRGYVVLPLGLQGEQPNSKTGPLVLDEELSKLLLGL